MFLCLYVYFFPFSFYFSLFPEPSPGWEKIKSPAFRLLLSHFALSACQTCVVSVLAPKAAGQLVKTGN